MPDERHLFVAVALTLLDWPLKSNSISLVILRRNRDVQLFTVTLARLSTYLAMFEGSGTLPRDKAAIRLAS